ncbi:methyltransferase regulatory domain-containing protein [Agrobacterium deltaense]|nr:methyltransferase regulatory domain-containing protein [Agrobacterium deltaense]
MANWTSGYIDELSYTHGFYRQLTPALMSFAALARSQKFDLSQPSLEYCELGCGQGFSANLLSAANPQIRFHAMDFNPAHIVSARSLAREANLTNVKFYEESFASFQTQAGLPESFDIICLHGVLSWVSEENRQHIVDFVSAKLKPGGLVYVSYNAMPGWAVTLPLRRMLVDRASRTSGPLAPRIDEALDHLSALAEAQADFFKIHAAAGVRLKTMTSMGRNYLAHEYFNRDWTPFYFEDVASQLAEAKLSFVSSLNFLDHFDDLSLSEKQRAVLDLEGDPVRREAVRDFIVNQLFRTDLFCKGFDPHTERSAAGVWLETRFALSTSKEKIPAAIKTRMGQIDVGADPYQQILATFDGRPRSTREVLTSMAGSQVTWSQITQAITVLVGANFLQPCLPEQGLAERIEGCKSFNRAVCRHAENNEDHQFLASPVTGGGLMVSRAERLYLLAIDEGKDGPKDWARLAWRILEPQGQRLLKDGKILETEEDNVAELTARAEEFMRYRLPILQSLKIEL